MSPKLCTTDRDELREWIPAGYRPAVHLIGMYGIGLAVIAWLSVTYLTSASAWQLMPVLALILGASLVEYVIHRWVMHVRKGWTRLAWEGHVGRHHHFFSDTKPAWNRPTDVWLVLFSPRDILTLTAVVAGPVALVWNILGATAGAVTIVSFISYFLFYEACHLAYHLPDGHWALRLPFLARMRTHHNRHHHPTDNAGNYALVGLWWDHVFRTKLP